MSAMEKLHENLKYIGLVAKSADGLDKIVKFFEKKNIEILFMKGHFDLGIKCLEIDEILKKTNFIISCGGDGTLISTARKLALKNAYVLGIHAGSLGFLTDIRLDELEKFWDEFCAGNYVVERPLMLEISLIKGKKASKFYAFNDVAISRKSAAPSAKIDAFLDGKYFNTYFGDGVIICSPTGSTAYNMSANGPIIYPLSDVFCVTPICSHSLTQRPLILPKKYQLSFKKANESAIVCVIDGQDRFEFAEFDEIKIAVNNTRANLIRHANRDYFDVLKLKLQWGYSEVRK